MIDRSKCVKMQVSNYANFPEEKTYERLVVSSYNEASFDVVDLGHEEEYLSGKPLVFIPFKAYNYARPIPEKKKVVKPWSEEKTLRFMMENLCYTMQEYDPEQYEWSFNEHYTETELKELIEKGAYKLVPSGEIGRFEDVVWE